MKKVKAVFMMTLMMISSAMMGQTTVKGVLMDKSLNEGEPFATIRVFKQGKTDKAVSMFVTDAEGRFSHEVNGKGSFDMVFSSIGKNDLKKTVQLGESKVLNLDTLYMEANATALQGVEVVAQKPLVKMEVDKMSYNVAEDEDSKSMTVLDMLRKVPMVSVDGQDNISVNGSQSFKVYVDGMPNVMFSNNPSMVFKSMPASAVKSIEVMTNPGAKYDAEGASGVLNIVMNRLSPMAPQSMNGYNGTVRASVGNKQMGGSAFVSGQQGKLSYSANVMTSYNKPGNTTTEMEQIQDNGMKQLMTSENNVKTPFTMGSLSLGYQIDPMSAINATASINTMSMKSTGTSTTTMGGNGFGDGFNYTTSTDMKNSRTSFSGSIDYQRFFNKERTQSLAVTYQLNYSPATTEMTSNFGTASSLIDLTDRYSENKDKTTNHTFQMDYTMPLGIGQTLSLGSKLQLHDATSDAKYYLKGTYDPSSSSDYEYKNTILAGYGEYAGNFNKFGLKAGLRYEQTWQDVKYHLGNGQDFSTNYSSLVPTASLQYTIAQGSNLGLSYNMRISRPGISYLNPYVDKTNPIARTYGNPDLDVEKAHNVSLVYNAFTTNLMLNLNLHHNFTDNAISQYSFYDNNNLLNTTYGNVVKRHQTGLGGYLNYLATADTRIVMKAAVNYTDLRQTQRLCHHLDQELHPAGMERRIQPAHGQPLEVDARQQTHHRRKRHDGTQQGRQALHRKREPRQGLHLAHQHQSAHLRRYLHRELHLRQHQDDGQAARQPSDQRLHRATVAGRNAQQRGQHAGTAGSPARTNATLTLSTIIISLLNMRRCGLPSVPALFNENVQQLSCNSLHLS